MIRILEDRIWLTDHPTPTVQRLSVSTPNDLIDRQQQLHELLATAPADQRQSIDRIVTSQLDPTEMHDYLCAAMATQDARRDWIITYWPHLVELEQVTHLTTASEPLAHWPAAQPDEVRDVLEQLRQLAPHLDAREERTLAELDRQEADNDPVRRLEARRDNLLQLATRATSTGERDAAESELIAITRQLREARRERAIQHTFDRYLPNETDAARATRITTLAHDTLTTQPTWVIDHIRRLHDNQQLKHCDVVDLATQITHAAASIDLHGHIADIQTEPRPTANVAPQPVPELG
jgi:hypothetical protein